MRVPLLEKSATITLEGTDADLVRYLVNTVE